MAVTKISLLTQNTSPPNTVRIPFFNPVTGNDESATVANILTSDQTISSVFGRTGVITAQLGDYSAFYVQSGGDLGGTTSVPTVTATHLASPLPIAQGGTGNSSGNAVNVTGTVAVANGGTGQTSFTNGQLLIGNTTGNTLTPATLTAGSAISVTNGTGTITLAVSGLTNSNLSGTAGITNANLANSSVTVTAGSGMSGGGSVSLGSSITLTNAGVTSNVAGTGVSVSGATGAVTITNTGVTSLTGTTNQVNVSGSTGSVTLSTPQNIHTGAAPTFAGLTLTGIETITIPNTGNTQGLTVTQNDTTNNPTAVSITNAGTGGSLSISQNNTGTALTITRNQSNGSSRMINFNQSNGSDPQDNLQVNNAGLGAGVQVNQTGNGNAINITANSVTTRNGLGITVNGVTNGSGINVSSTSTAGTTSGNSFMLNLARSGSNANSSHTAYGISSSVINTGTTSTNIGVYTSASGATNNYGLIVNAGSSGFNVTTPTALVHIAAGSATANTAPLQFNSGTLETTARAGVEEYNGNHYLTNAGPLRFSLGGTLFDHFADAGNTHTDGATFDDLYSDTLLANTFNVNGDKIKADYSGTFVASATATRDIKVLFAGSTILDTGALTTTAAESWDIDVLLIRESSTVVRCMATIRSSTSLGVGAFTDTTYTRLTGLTLSGTNILKIQAVSGSTGAASNDVVAKLGSILYQPSA